MHQIKYPPEMLVLVWLVWCSPISGSKVGRTAASRSIAPSLGRPLFQPAERCWALSCCSPVQQCQPGCGRLSGGKLSWTDQSSSQEQTLCGLQSKNGAPVDDAVGALCARHNTTTQNCSYSGHSSCHSVDPPQSLRAHSCGKSGVYSSGPHCSLCHMPCLHQQGNWPVLVFLHSRYQRSHTCVVFWNTTRLVGDSDVDNGSVRTQKNKKHININKLVYFYS